MCLAKPPDGRWIWIPRGHPAAEFVLSQQSVNLGKKKLQLSWPQRGEMWIFNSHAHLEDSHYGPEKRVKVLPVWLGVAIPLRRKLTTKQMHSQDTEKGQNKQEIMFP